MGLNSGGDKFHGILKAFPWLTGLLPTGVGKPRGKPLAEGKPCLCCVLVLFPGTPNGKEINNAAALGLHRWLGPFSLHRYLWG